MLGRWEEKACMLSSCLVHGGCVLHAQGSMSLTMAWAPERLAFSKGKNAV